MVKVSSFLQKSLIFLLQVYRYLISPLIGHYCRFYPSCSKYAQIAIGRYGACKGSYLTLRRLLCCHPLHTGGYDPVPSLPVSKLYSAHLNFCLRCRSIRNPHVSCIHSGCLSSQRAKNPITVSIPTKMS